MQSFDFAVNLALINLDRFEQLSAIAMSPHRAARVTCPAMLSRHSDILFSHRGSQLSEHSEVNFLLFNWGAIPSVHNVGFEDLLQQSSWVTT